RHSERRRFMPINIVHVSDIHFGSGEGHGRLNPSTGLNVRFEDFVVALSRVVDYCIEHAVEIFLFSGDAYRNASPEPIYQMMFARELKRLSDAGIQCVLLVGNHDQILKSTASHAMSVFQSLEVPRVKIFDRPGGFRIETGSGGWQLNRLPDGPRPPVGTPENHSSLAAAGLDRELITKIDDLLKGLYDQLDPALPTIVTA